MPRLSQLSRQADQTIEDQAIASHAMHADEGIPYHRSCLQLYACSTKLTCLAIRTNRL